MPTGYTQKIAEGITFKEFALGCARAFGACIEMRDDPMDAAIPAAFKPSTYNQERAIALQADLTKLEAMTPEQCEQAAKEEYQGAITYHKSRIVELNQLKAKYEAMLTQVQAWVPPSSDHENLKKFMAEQITESIDFDCGLKYHQENLESLFQSTGRVWREKKVAELQRQIIDHEDQQQKENNRAQRNTQWVQRLRESLK